MKKMKALFAALAALMIMLTGFASAERSGWVETGDGRMLYSYDGRKITGWYQEGNDWYYLNNAGKLARNWFRLSCGIFHAACNGKIDEGWQRFNGIWYCLRKVNIGTEEKPEMVMRWYYVDGSDEMPFGRKNLAGSVYKVENTKEPLSGWNEQNGVRAYFNTDGTANTGWIKVDDEYYFLDASARVMRGTKYINGEYYELNKDGALNLADNVFPIDEKTSARKNETAIPSGSVAAAKTKTTETVIVEKAGAGGTVSAEVKEKNEEKPVVQTIDTPESLPAEAPVEVSVTVPKEEPSSQPIVQVVENQETLSAEVPVEVPVTVPVEEPASQPVVQIIEIQETLQAEQPAEKSDAAYTGKASVEPMENPNVQVEEKQEAILIEMQPDPVAPVVTTKTETVEEEIPFETEYQNDDTRFTEDGNKTIQAGKNGKKAISYSVTYTDGVETSREKTGETVTTAAVNEIISVPCKGHVVEVKEESQEEAVAFETETREDSSRIKGDADQVIQEGEDGVKTYVYTVTYTDGKETGRTLKSDLITKQPVNKIVSVATGEKPSYTEAYVTEEEEIPYTSEQREYDIMYKGKTDTVQEGINGKKEVKYLVVTDGNGNQISKEVVSEKIKKPMQPEIIGVGTFEPTYTTQVVHIDLPGMHGTRSSSLDAECVAWAQTMANNKKVEHDLSSGQSGGESVGGWGSASAAASGVAAHGGTVIAWSEYWGAGCVSLIQTLPGGGTKTVYYACARSSGGFLEGTPIDTNND